MMATRHVNRCFRLLSPVARLHCRAQTQNDRVLAVAAHPAAVPVRFQQTQSSGNERGPGVKGWPCGWRAALASRAWRCRVSLPALALYSAPHTVPLTLALLTVDLLNSYPCSAPECLLFFVIWTRWFGTYCDDDDDDDDDGICSKNGNNDVG